MKKSTLVFSFLIYWSAVLGQCTTQVQHLSGSMTINGVSVTVNSSGVTDSNFVYCSQTIPYFIGYTYNPGLSGNGYYSFTFSPPVTAVTLNFSGTSNVSGHYEEVRVYVNDGHYAIPSPGEPNSCDDLAVLTPEGNIAGCNECSVSGWIGTTIPGPIYSLRVDDTVFLGAPAGTIFSLFMCEGLTTNIEDNKTETWSEPFPNPFIDQTILQIPPFEENATFTLYDVSGRLIRKLSNIKGGQLFIERDNLTSGLYYFVLTNEDKVLAKGKLIAE